jgi:hypothetical protein
MRPKFQKLEQQRQVSQTRPLLRVHLNRLTQNHNTQLLQESSERPSASSRSAVDTIDE